MTKKRVVRKQASRSVARYQDVPSQSKDRIPVSLNKSVNLLHGGESRVSGKSINSLEEQDKIHMNSSLPPPSSVENASSITTKILLAENERLKEELQTLDSQARETKQKLFNELEVARNLLQKQSSELRKNTSSFR